MIKSEIREMLSTGYTTVVFYKLNRQLREMVCTLDPNLIPPKVSTNVDKVTTPKPENVEVIRVYEKDIGWRSITLVNIISTTKLEVL